MVIKMLASLLFVFTACASVPQPVLLQNRTLEISSDKAEAFYHYEVCVKKFLLCTKKEWITDTYDLNDKEFIQKLKGCRMKNWNPFSFEQWIAWVAASLAAAIGGSVGLINYADGRYENKEQAQIKYNYSQKDLEKIGKELEKINVKLDGMIPIIRSK
jgi:hypothetical protein